MTMREKQITLVHESGKEIEAIVKWDELDMSGEVDVYYRHVLTGDLNESIRNVLSGWKEHNEKDNAEWKQFVHNEAQYDWTCNLDYDNEDHETVRV